MKFAIAYYLLLIYSTVILKPLIPVAEDAVFHCFAEAYHVATVHAIYGNNHLAKEEANATDDSNNNSAKNTLKTEDAVAFHILATPQDYSIQIFNPQRIYYINPKTPLHKIVLTKPAPPPKFSRDYITI
ncbi:MAG: hypothetical protein ABJB05_09080 [Parafilimonas sp.]